MPYGIKQFFDIAYIIQCLTMSRNQPLTCSLLQGDKNRCFCDCNVMLSTTTINIWIKKKKTAATYIGTLKPGLVEQALLLWGTVISFSFSFFCFIWLRFTSMPVFFFFFFFRTMLVSFIKKSSSWATTLIVIFGRFRTIFELDKEKVIMTVSEVCDYPFLCIIFKLFDLTTVFTFLNVFL